MVTFVMGTTGSAVTRPETSKQMMKLIRVKIGAKVKGNRGTRSQEVSGVGIDQMISEEGGQERKR